MTDYRRTNFPGGYYFFTVVTHDRRAIFAEPLARACLRAAWDHTKRQMPFEDVAVCLLPDHLHCVWKLPDDADFSLRWARIKAGLARCYLEAGGTESTQSRSRRRKRERGIWQHIPPAGLANGPTRFNGFGWPRIARKPKTIPIFRSSPAMTPTQEK